MEFKVIFWIVVGIIWLIRQFLTKKKETSIPTQEGSINQTIPVLPKGKDIASKAQRKIDSPFRDNLNKSPGSLLKSKKENLANQPKEYVLQNYESNIVDEESDILKKLKTDREEAGRMKLRSFNTVNEGSFEPYKDHSPAPTKIFEMLQNPEDVKNAIVIAEIMKTKF